MRIIGHTNKLASLVTRITEFLGIARSQGILKTSCNERNRIVKIYRVQCFPVMISKIIRFEG